MNRQVARPFWILVALQALFLLSWAGWHEMVRSRSPVLLLEAAPVDPQDLLRGDYMVLRYDIGDLPLPEGAAEGDTAWVLLEPRGAYYKAASLSLGGEPPLAPGQVAARGYVAGGRVEFGIERYFVPQGMGQPRFEKIEVEAAASPTGELYIKRVLIDGKAYP
jgi:uncharacterized membrane-anchored protein